VSFVLLPVSKISDIVETAVDTSYVGYATIVLMLADKMVQIDFRIITTHYKHAESYISFSDRKYNWKTGSSFKGAEKGLR